MYDPTAAAASSLGGDGCSGNGVGRRVMVMGSARGVVVGDGLLFLVDEDGARDLLLPGVMMEFKKG
ncbi:hypothetical protein Dimus_034238 [Dionaea muscipula]